MQSIFKNVLVLSPCLLAIGVSEAQDSSKRKTIEITSTFKPSLKESAKVNFNASPPAADTSTPRLAYNIPANNLFFTYRPAELKPVALRADTVSWTYNNFIKVGIGNVHQPYVKAGFSFGDRERSFINVFADHYTSKGDLPFQKNSLTRILGAATYRTVSNHEWSGSLGFSSEDYFLYGYRPDSLEFTKDDLRQRFQTIEAKASFRNTLNTEFGLYYQPNISVSVFADKHQNKTSEANTVLNLPMTKSIGSNFNVHLGVTADLTGYRLNESDRSQSNNIFLIKPSVVVKYPNFYLHAGLIPSWDQGNFKMLPNFMADFNTDDQNFSVQVGWIGYFNKGSYQRFASINPWLSRPDSLINTRVQEGYVGFRGSAGNHLSYSAKVGFHQHRNMPLFVNDTLDGKTFLVVYEPKLNQIRVHGEVEYAQGEQFSAKAGLTWNQFSKLQQERKAWGILPIEFNANVRWQVMKDLWVRSDLWAWRGAFFREKDGSSNRGEGAFDLNAGAEFRITKNFNLWLQMSNIFNNRYERWNQYESFGFNILGGVVYNFNQK